jgi:hypothetical protein
VMSWCSKVSLCWMFLGRGFGVYLGVIFSRVCSLMYLEDCSDPHYFHLVV